MTVSPILSAVRATTPLVHCMTNTVVPQITANVLLAVGAAPAMIDLPEEAEIFAGIASALLINVGNGSSEQHRGMRLAVAAAEKAGTPWVLDPVAVGAPLRPHRSSPETSSPTVPPRSEQTPPRSSASLAPQRAAEESTPPTRPTQPSTQPDNWPPTLAQWCRHLRARRRRRLLRPNHPRHRRQHAHAAGHRDWCSALGATVAAALGATRGPDHSAHDAVVAAHAIFGAAGLVAERQTSAPAPSNRLDRCTPR